MSRLPHFTAIHGKDFYYDSEQIERMKKTAKKILRNEKIKRLYSEEKKQK